MRLNAASLALPFSMAAGLTANAVSFSVLVNKPELLLRINHLPNEGSPKFVPLTGTYHYDESYQSLPYEKLAPAKTIISQLVDDNLNRRDLQMAPGHLMDILAGECNSEDIYQHTNYDDQYEPECECYQDQGTGVIWVECYLGDESCEAPTEGTDDIRDVCSGTHELFFFGDDDGKLSSKITCTICRSENCNGVMEICTEVQFGDDHEPEACQVIQLPTDISASGIACGNCTICEQEGKKGIQQNCFGNPDPDGCDTEALAHLHNFAPRPAAGDTPVGGLFGDICSATSPDLDLYSLVTYQAGLEALCDCEDPSSAIIFCDLYISACFANVCTEISEVFFFSEGGAYEGKWTINWEPLLWTQTLFDTTTGVATSCSVLQSDPKSGQPIQCTNCQICDSAQDGKGVAFDCFGAQQDTECDATNGRAKYNFDIPEEVSHSPPVKPPPADVPSPLPTTTPPPAATPAPTLPVQNVETTSTENEQPTEISPGIVLGALFGGMAFALLIVVIAQNVQRQPPAPASPVNNTTAGRQTMVAPYLQESAPPIQPDIEGKGDMEDFPLPGAAGRKDPDDEEEEEEELSAGFLA